MLSRTSGSSRAMMLAHFERSDWQRAGGKDYGWAFGISGVVVVEIWYPPGVERWTLPWSDAA